MSSVSVFHKFSHTPEKKSPVNPYKGSVLPKCHRKEGHTNSFTIQAYCPQQVLD